MPWEGDFVVGIVPVYLAGVYDKIVSGELVAVGGKYSHAGSQADQLHQQQEYSQEFRD